MMRTRVNNLILPIFFYMIDVHSTEIRVGMGWYHIGNRMSYNTTRVQDPVIHYYDMTYDTNGNPGLYRSPLLSSHTQWSLDNRWFITQPTTSLHFPNERTLKKPLWRKLINVDRRWYLPTWPISIQKNGLARRHLGTYILKKAISFARAKGWELMGILTSCSRNDPVVLSRALPTLFFSHLRSPVW